MAGPTKRIPVTIVSDSQGVGLQSLIDNQMQLYSHFQVRVLVYKGKGIVEAVERVKPKLASLQRLHGINLSPDTILFRR